MTKYIWVDLETTGLDPDLCQIIEAACIITDDDCNILGEYEAVVNPGHVAYEPGTIAMHKKSGLIDKVARGKVLADVENEIMELVLQHEPRRKRAYLAGSNVHFDRSFLVRYMPTIAGHVCSRHLDVSAIGMAMRTRFGKEIAEYRAPRPHRAKDDLMRSITEYKWHMDNFVKTADEVAERPRQSING